MSDETANQDMDDPIIERIGHAADCPQATAPRPSTTDTEHERQHTPGATAAIIQLQQQQALQAKD